jgi:hypothetical protein
VGAALWGDCDWHGHDVDIDINQYNNFTKNVNATSVAQKRSDFQANQQNWKHNPENRKGTQYRDPATQQRYARAADPRTTQAREDFRGRAEQGRQDLGRAGGEQVRPGGAGGGQPSPERRQIGAGGGGQRSGAPGAPGAIAGRDAGQARPGAFEGMGQGQDVQAFSDRGQASRRSMAAAPRGGSAGGALGGAAGVGGRRR